ncbi:hypothetical protein TSUD_43050 [Trifolium subterraneum]|uniref:Tr-type G domain-containing protein n=1 Tax=Trifolium subterraneum TaxID=3900 RepID=A0A2Z6MEM0_TRISU|nr:hypothetical protein TSUD_43050 [Trifolium subterraneum]
MENNKPTDVKNPPTMKSPVTDDDGDDNGVDVVFPAPQQDDKVPEVGSREKEGEDETVESAAAKKRRKKKEKEKEKEKKAAAATAGSAAVIETVEETAETSEPKKIDSKSNKKVPKHVREMQELLARRKEAEERKKREEEEKLRKEEEERQRLEELERIAEEAKRIKKEKEKQKLETKRIEGKLLTDKMKREARRLEAMKRQIINSGGVNLPVKEDIGAPAKKPVYQTRTRRSTNRNHNGEVSVKTDESGEAKETITDLDSEEPSVQMEDNVELPEAVEEDEWDERSGDDVNLNDRGAFADDEETVLKPAVEETEDRKQAKVVVEDKKKNHDPQQSSVPSSPSDGNLRSPICCIMGHVDTGKTKLLDCIRGTNVQGGEAGGITQQIGATYFPAKNIRERTKELKADATLKVPGLLVIDTPGHESFNNLRSRGSGLCDIAILVVDIMHGLEPQTIESLNLLKMRNTEFIIALNKVDRIFGWKTCRNAPIRKAMTKQSKDVKNEFNMRVTQIVTQFKEQGLNTELYYKNKEMGETFSIVPTSAITCEGIPDMLLLLVQWTQRTMIEKLTFTEEVQCTVLEVKVIEGHGTTIDVVLVNGVLHEGDQIVVSGMQGPIVTTIRALLTPHPMKELRVKGSYIHHKEIKAAMGIKITAQGLEHAIAGASLYVIGTPICIPSQDFIDIGRIASIEINNKPVNHAMKGQEVAIKIVGCNSEEKQKAFGRHFDIDDELVSRISRRSIDVLKTNHRDDLSMEVLKLVATLKRLFKIQ